MQAPINRKVEVIMVIILLVIIYLSFISLGLPDAILGTTWPAMRTTFNVSIDAAGPLAMISTVSAIASGLLSGRINKWLGTGKVVFFSCLMTGLGLFGMSVIPSYAWALLLAIPLGLGAGSVDASLNNYVALHYKAHHMNWLHSFWGLGATLGPIIISTVLVVNGSWRSGYRTISLLQLSLAVILLITLPLWKKVDHLKGNVLDEAPSTPSGKGDSKKAIHIKGVPFAIAVFMFYCAAEISVGLWGSSYLIQTKGIGIERAAFMIAMYYGGITVGRILSGFVSFKVNNKTMIRLGIVISFLAGGMLLLPLPGEMVIVPLVLFGIGLAPIFPAMIHETPVNFGKEHSQTIIGYQMAAAYSGSAIMPPLFGWIMDATTLAIFPIFIFGCIALVLVSSERLKRLKHA